MRKLFSDKDRLMSVFGIELWKFLNLKHHITNNVMCRVCAISLVWPKTVTNEVLLFP
jgi:hypothetical protein